MTSPRPLRCCMAGNATRTATQASGCGPAHASRHHRSLVLGDASRPAPGTHWPNPYPKTGRFSPRSVTPWHHHVHCAGFGGLISASLNNLKAPPWRRRPPLILQNFMIRQRSYTYWIDINYSRRLYATVHRFRRFPHAKAGATRTHS